MTKEHNFLKYLQRVDLDLTGLCNRQCSFCPRSKDYPNINKHMSFKTLDIVLNELRQIKFTGVLELAGRGESTLHKNFYDVVKRCNTDKSWKLRLTTNGYRIEKWWDDIAHEFDMMILNSYDSKEEFLFRQTKYEKLPTGEFVEQHYKPDGLSVEEINKLPSHKTKTSKINWVYQFNNRAGYFNDKGSNIPCWHPMRQIFIDYEGNYQMCCNDWTHQIKIGNVHEKSLIDLYINDPKLNRIRQRLIVGQRSEILPCSKCDDVQGKTKVTTSIITFFRQSDHYKNHVAKIAGNEGKNYRQDLLKGI